MHRTPALLAVSCIVAIAACGARTPLGVGGDVASNDGGVPGCNADATLALVATATLDTHTDTHEPEERASVVWTGSSFVVAWARYNDGVYDVAVTRVDASTTAVTVALPPASTFDPGKSFPLNLRASWDGASVAVFWALDDESIVMRRFDADGRALGGAQTVVAPTGAQTIVTSALFAGDAHVLSWAVQNGSSWNTFVQRIAADGTPRGAPVRLYFGGGYDFGAHIVARGADLFAAWSVHDEDLPTAIETTFVAALDAAGAPQMTESVLRAVENGPVDLVAEATRLDLLMWDPENQHATLLSRTTGTFQQRASFDTALGAPRIVLDACGRLVLVTPTGAFSQNNPIPTGLSFVRVGETGAVGAPIALQSSADDIEDFDVARGADGVLIATLEGGQGTTSPSRVLRVTYVRAR